MNMFFRREPLSEPVRLYRRLRKADAAKLAQGAPAGVDTRFVAYSRGCGGGTSFLIREEAPNGACRAYVVLATYEASGVEESSFATPEEAMRFAGRAVEALAGA